MRCIAFFFLFLCFFLGCVFRRVCMSKLTHNSFCVSCAWRKTKSEYFLKSLQMYSNGQLLNWWWQAENMQQHFAHANYAIKMNPWDGTKKQHTIISIFSALRLSFDISNNLFSCLFSCRLYAKILARKVWDNQVNSLKTLFFLAGRFEQQFVHLKIFKFR